MITLDEIRHHCLKKEKVTEDLPFDESTLAFRIGGKIFLLTDIDAEILSINLKCDPQKAIELRDNYPEIRPGYHMNKRHWNTVLCEGDLPRTMILELIDHSHELVLASLPRKLRQEILCSSTSK